MPIPRALPDLLIQNLYFPPTCVRGATVCKLVAMGKNEIWSLALLV